MSQKAGLEIHADIKPLVSELQKAITELRQFNQNALNAASGVNKLGNAGDNAAKRLKNTTFASQALATALGYLGLNSIQGVIYKLISFGERVFDVTRNLQAVESQARAVFGDAFPQLQKEADALGQQFRRSGSDVLKFMAGFGDFLDQLGASPAVTRSMSTQLAQMTLEFSKLKQNIPDDQIFDALQQGLTGNYKALRQLDILIKDDTLQQFANGLAIRNKVKDMDSEQTAIITSLYLQEQLRQKQAEIEKSTGKLGDSAKSAGAAWQDLQEALGTSVGPLVARGLSTLADALNLARQNTDILKQSWMNLLDAFGVGVAVRGFGAVSDALKQNQSTTQPKRSGLPVFTFGASFGPTAPTAEQLSILNRIPRNTAAGGGGASPAANAADELAKAEQAVLQALGDQASVNLDNLRLRKEDLETRKKLGILTKDEEQQLERINRRLVFQDDALNDMVATWQDQKDAIEQANKALEDYQKQLDDLDSGLNSDLEKIDSDAAQSRQDQVTALIRERNQIREQGSGAVGITGDMSRRLGEIEAILQTATPEEIEQGEHDATLSPLQQTTQDAAQKKADLTHDELEKRQQIVDEIAKEKQNIKDLESQNATTQQAIVDALDDRLTKTQTNYALEEQATKDHVANQITEIDKLIAKYRELGNASGAEPMPTDTTSVNRASGGMVYGPGGPTDDRIKAWLSNGEYVINAAATRMYRPLIEKINRMTLPMPRFATGGYVSNSSTQTISVHQNNYGEAARLNVDPRMIRWQLRKLR